MRTHSSGSGFDSTCQSMAAVRLCRTGRRVHVAAGVDTGIVSTTVSHLHLHRIALASRWRSHAMRQHQPTRHTTAGPTKPPAWFLPATRPPFHPCAAPSPGNSRLRKRCLHTAATGLAPRWPAALGGRRRSIDIEAGPGARQGSGVMRDATAVAARSNRGKYIPLTRGQLLRCLMEDGLWDGPGQTASSLEQLATLVDAVVHGWYRERSVLLGDAYTPFDPDREAVRLDDEVLRPDADQEGFIRELEHMVEHANYEEVSEQQLGRLLVTKSDGGVTIKPVPKDQYHTLRLFVRGVQTGAAFTKSLGLSSWSERVQATKEGGAAVFRRVLVVVRYTAKGHLYLKLFKQVPVGQLDVLLPNAVCRMGLRDQLLIGSVALAGVGVATYRATSAMVADRLGGSSSIGAACTGGVLGVLAFQAWAGYQRKRHEYNTSLVNLLWAANLDNNRGVLQRLTDQAEEEEFKEAVLTYAFLATSPLPLTPLEVSGRVETWVRNRFGERIEFDVSDGLDKLGQLGLGRCLGNGTWQAVPVDTALRTLQRLYNDLSADVLPVRIDAAVRAPPHHTRADVDSD